MNEKSSSSNSGIGFFGFLTIVFITLKLLGKIDWSWWWILLPAYGPIALIIIFFGLCFFGLAIFKVYKSKCKS